MSGKSSPSRVHRSPVPVEPKTLQALFDTVKGKHASLKSEVKALFNRSRSTGEVSVFKSLLMQYPPLHSLNDLLDDCLESPLKFGRATGTGKSFVTPQTTSKSCKKRSGETVAVAASKSLKFSPHLFKKEAAAAPSTTSVSKGSPNGGLEMVLNDNEDKDDEDDDIIEIEGL